MRAAILSGNTVTRVIILNELSEYPGAIDGTGANPGDTWNGVSFVRPTKQLAQAKQDARDAIIARWQQAESDGIAFQTKTFNTDAISLSRLGVLARRARQATLDSVPFTIALLAADDSAVTLSRSEILDLDKAVGDRFKALSDNARTLRQAVVAATTVAEVEAININAGW